MKNWILIAICIGLLLISCKEKTEVDYNDFELLMNNVAEGWSTQNTILALSSFDKDAIFMEPPNTQYYKGHEQLRPYFDELTNEHKMIFHHLWFDFKSQTGACEFTFSYGKETADTGIAVVELKSGKIKFWREYHKKGPVEFNEYISTDNKVWEWHIGNYPVTQDSMNLK